MSQNDAHDSQLLKGVLSLALLRLLAERESYGYELVTRLHDLGLTEVQDGSVYPALGRLERDAQVTSRLVASASGAARKYYRLSASGYAELAHIESAWNSLVRVIEPIVSRPVPPRPKEALQ
ncbi:MAG: PadR family transcriptional regulator [Candidatus Dormiibacterota bacterium]